MDISDDSLRKLKNTSKRLNSAADQATKKLEELSAWLAENGPGITVYLGKMLHDEDHDDHGVYYCLGYDRHGDKWQLVVSETTWKHRRDADGERISDGYDGFESDSQKSVLSISQTPRVVRIKAVPRMQELVDEICKQADDLAKAAE